ncbi:MAG: hypothetical protein A2019_04475 [Sulfurimonas sp. GWF2_37_8]|nr:MAG: hypothetical protein A2019_04475 [Sulfurimonas sp. GWF2_37_8]
MIFVKLKLMKNILNRFFYKLCRKIGILLFDKELSSSLHNINHILLINWHGKIGDAIISSFIFREIKEKTNIKISIITTKELKSIYKYYNSDSIHIIDSNHSLIDINNIANKIKKVDIIIPLIGTLGFNDLFFINKLTPLYVFSTDETLKLSNKNFLKEVNEKLVNEIYYKILEYMNIDNINDNYIIPHTKKEINIIQYDILFNPFGSRNDKSLSINKSVSILQKINKVYPNLKIIILFSPNTKHTAYKIIKKTNCKNIILAKNIFTIKDSIDLINKSDIVISVDTSIVHISIGMNKKLISIYYKAGNSFNAWLPKKSLKTKIIFSLGKDDYMTKDMNKFNDDEIIQKINFFKDLNSDKK